MIGATRSTNIYTPPAWVRTWGKQHQLLSLTLSLDTVAIDMYNGKNIDEFHLFSPCS